MRRCPLCGYRFSDEESRSCTTCPLKGKCGVLCCPHCGYSWVEESRLVEAWRRRTGRGGRARRREERRENAT